MIIADLTFSWRFFRTENFWIALNLIMIENAIKSLFKNKEDK